MFKEYYDVIIAGGGVMGLAAAWRLSMRGAKVLLLDKYGIPSGVGSSFGQTRLIRKAYFEHPNYVPLLEYAGRLWNELEEASHRRLFYKTGLMVSGPEHDPILIGIRESARLHDLKITQISSEDLPRQYPHFRHPPHHVGIYEEDAGCLLVEPILETLKSLTLQRGVVMKPYTPLTRWTASSQGVAVQTPDKTFHAAKLILSMGSWMAPELATTGLTLKIKRAPVFWFDAPQSFNINSGMQCFAFVLPEGFFYGFPDIEGSGVKIALHRGLHPITNLDDLSIEIRDGDFEPVQSFVKRHVPALSPQYKSYSVCRYSLTEDEHFILGPHPQHANVILASPCSGHGFKFAPTIGDALADLSLNNKTSLPIDFLAPGRFQ